MTWKRAYRKAMVDRNLRVDRIRDQVPADLLIPARLLPHALRLKTSTGEWRDVVAYLVGRHRGRVLQLAEGAGNLRFRYQGEGLKLRRICYVPYRDMIAELRMLSFASRVSMCALVVLMLEWEQEGDGSPEVGIFIGTTRRIESGWTKEGTILIIAASIQMSCAPEPTSTA